MSFTKAPLRSNPAPLAIKQETAISGRPTLFFALALSLGVLGVYVFTLSNNYSQDSMAFAMLATHGRPTDPLFFQAEHLLWPFAGWLWYQLWVFFGYKEGALAPMQILNSVGGAAGAGFIFLSLRALLGKSQAAIMVSLLSALLLACSYGYWYHSTEAEDQVIANAIVLGTFLLLALRMIGTKQDSYSLYTVKATGFRSTAIKLAGSRASFVLTMSLAILFHGTAVLFLPALLLGLWLKERNMRSALAVLVGVLALVAAAFLVVGGLAHGFRSPGEYLSWLLSAPKVGVWGRFSPRSLWIGVQTMANAIVFLQGGPGFKAILSGAFRWSNLLSAALFFGVWAITALVAVYCLRYRRRLAGQGRIILVCFVWFALVGLFNFYWAPEDIQFWFGLVPPLVVALALAHFDLVGAMKPREELLHSVFIFGLAGIFVINLLTSVIPRANVDNNTGLYKTACLEHSASPNDLFITPGWDWASSYLPYFTRLQVLSIVDTYLLQAGGDQARLSRLMDERMAETTAKGGKVYAVRLFSLDQNESDWFKRTTGLTTDDFPFERKQAWACGGEVVWEIVKQ